MPLISFVSPLRSQMCPCQTTWWPPLWVCCPPSFSTPTWAPRSAPWRTSSLSRASVATLCSACRWVPHNNKLTLMKQLRRTLPQVSHFVLSWNVKLRQENGSCKGSRAPDSGRFSGFFIPFFFLSLSESTELCTTDSFYLLNNMVQFFQDPFTCP